MRRSNYQEISLSKFGAAIIVLAALLIGAASEAHVPKSGEYSEANDQKCAKLKDSFRFLDSQKLEDLYFCSEYAYNNIGDFYASALHFSYRIYNQDPSDFENITSIIWWEWSRYNDHWNVLPGNEGQDGLINALRIAKRAAAIRANRNDIDFNMNLGKMMMIVGRFFNTKTQQRENRPEFLNYARDRFLTVEKSAEAPTNVKVQAQMALGHIARYTGDTESSRQWYTKALELTPQNDSALRNLARLDQ
jgi:tetratricopeptide (TPR) repeat protein